MDLKEIQIKATKLRDKEGNPEGALKLIESYHREHEESDKEWVQFLLLKAVLYRDTGDTKSSLNTYKEALKYIPKEDVETKADTLRSMAFLAIHTTGLKDAKELALQAINLLKESGDEEYLRVKANSYAVLGNIFYDSGLLDKALINYNKALNYAEASEFIERIITLVGDIANVHISKKEYQEALELITKYLDEARSSYRIALPQYYLRRAKIYFKIKKIDMAENDIKRAIEISQKEGWFRDLGECYEALGNIYLGVNKDKASKYFREAMEIYERGDYKRLINRVKEKI
jgi:tetratricopeptide (TPR) repeat protein